MRKAISEFSLFSHPFPSAHALGYPMLPLQGFSADDGALDWRAEARRYGVGRTGALQGAISGGLKPAATSGQDFRWMAQTFVGLRSANL